MASGIFFTEGQVKNAARVAVLGQTVVDQLFGGSDPIGQTIRIKNLSFQVLGVLAKKGQTAWGQDQDDTVIVPYTTIMKKFLRGVLYVQSGSVGAVPAPLMRPRSKSPSCLRQRHRLGHFQDDDFTVRNLSEIADTPDATNRIMTAWLASIAAVSLIVGGIGIMNIMLVAVSERTREIGIRMAIGARPNHVRIQFLSESILLCIWSAILGLFVGLGGSIGMAKILGWPTLVSYNSIFISILFSAAIGIFFGYYPAHKAAAMDPIEALHYE